MKKKIFHLFCLFLFCFINLSLNLCYPTDSTNFQGDSVILRSHPHYNTAMHDLYKKERERFKRSSRKKNKKRHNPRRRRDILSKESENSKDLLNRQIIPPNPEEKINIYRTMTVDLGAATGNIILDNSIANEFSPDEFSNINLTLQDYSALRLKTNGDTTLNNGDVTLKEDDIINVDGKGIVIEVAGNFYVNGRILFSEDSDLTFKFVDGDARVIFSAGSLGDLENSVEVRISGRGVAEAADGFVINMKGDSSNIEELPVFIVEDHSTFMPSEGAINTIQGIGKILVRDGAVIDVQGFGSTKRLIVGNSREDFIPIEVRDSAMIRLEGGNEGAVRQLGYAPPSGNLGQMSIQKTVSDIKVWLGGIIYIGENGWLEINTNNAELSQGYVTEMDFNVNGNLFVKSGGLFSCAKNKDCSNCGAAAPVIWFGEDGSFKGSGLVEYIGRGPATGYNYQGFVGTFQAPNAFFNSPDGVEFEDLAKILVNENSNLLTAIEFTDQDGIRTLRLKNGQRVAITLGDSLTDEDESGNVLGVASDGRQVLYSLSGVRSFV